jgi:BirA family biotin operon repressor/biotin-[acetyl-CoA-carboxylase] ligase
MGKAAPLLPACYALKQYGEIDSTNAEALRLAAGGETGPLWVWASAQSAGRGRDGRTWISETGNLYASLLMLSPEVARAAELSFVVALALHDAAAHCLDGNTARELALKWPNDLLLGGKKTAGLLLEQNGVGHIVIGCGLNLSHVPGKTRVPATCLATAGVHITPARGLELLANTFDNWLGTWQKDGFAPVRKAWLARAKGLGEPITVRLPEGELHGTFDALDTDGALILKQDNGETSRILAGDVFFST